MILIADSGSTKTDWRLIDGQNITQFTSIGLNPDFVTSEKVTEVVENTFGAVKGAHILEIHFYGSGCSSESRNDIIAAGLKIFFRNTEITIHHDLLGAARASCGKNAGIAGILGTGSNACLFDGREVVKEFRSGGYIIGDEGGGVDIGKRIIKKFIEGKFEDADILKRFKHRYKVSVDDILENLYRKPQPNKYLATFSQFAFHHRENPEISTLLESSFQAYFDNQVHRFHNSENLPLNLVGSVAFYYQEIIRKVAAKNGITINTILEKPISGLTLYHSELGLQ